MSKKSKKVFLATLLGSFFLFGNPAMSHAYGAPIANYAPALELIADKIADEGQELSFSVFASDPDGDSIIYSSSALPKGATLNKVTVAGSTYALFKWTPSYEQSGAYSVRFMADDGKGGSDSRIISITIKDVPVAKDVVAPTIKNIAVTNTTENSATIAWSTDERALGKIEYGASVSYGNTTSYTSTSTISSSQTASGLKPGTLYHYRIYAKDESGNEGTSGDNAFSTTPLEVVLQGKKRGEIKEGSLIRRNGDVAVFVIKNGKKTHIASPAVFNERGYKWENIIDVGDSIFEDYKEVSSLVRVAYDPRVYFITETGLKKWIRTPEIFNSYANAWDDITFISQKDLDSYPDVTLVRFAGNDKVYKLDDNKKRWIKTAQAFRRLGYRWDAIVSINKTEFDFYAEGNVIE